MSDVSYSAIKTISIFEIKDFFKEFHFNIIAPLINTFLFVLIFSTINKFYILDINGDSYINFLIPGVVIMIVIQTSFNHLSEVIISMKQTGSFNDYLCSPISRIEIFISFMLSSIVVCTFVGVLNLLILSIFSDFVNLNYFKIFYYILATVITFSSLGALIGFVSFTWDFTSAISNFFVIPVSFLSGTFFPISSLDSEWEKIFTYNPIFHIVEGFRGAFIQKEINIHNDVFIILTVFIFFVSSLLIFKKGYKVIF
jgi:ABC-2 type transport system permease protein